MPEKKKFSIVRISCLLVGVLAGVYLAGALAAHGIRWKQERDFVRKHPELTLPLRPLERTGIADLSNGMTLQANGYTMKFPWPEAGATVRPTHRLTLIGLPDHTSVVVSRPENSIFKSQAQVMSAMFGERSTYQWVAAALEETGDKLSLFHSDESNMLVFLSLMTKFGAVMGESPSAFYRVSLGELKGFEVGDPAANKIVRLLLFDSSDREFEILLRQPEAGKLTQEQVNAVVASVRAE